VIDAALDAALARAKRIHFTTFSAAGTPGTVPVWFMRKDGRLYFTTARASLKARRIQASGRVRVHVGAADGPAFDATARLVDDRPDLEREILGAYRRKYPLVVPLFMGWFIRRRLARKDNVVIEITPA
jgi:PPOX class probable F420-dependent enzyme